MEGYLTCWNCMGPRGACCCCIRLYSAKVILWPLERASIWFSSPGSGSIKSCVNACGCCCKWCCDCSYTICCCWKPCCCANVNCWCCCATGPVAWFGRTVWGELWNCGDEFTVSFTGCFCTMAAVILSSRSSMSLFALFGCTTTFFWGWICCGWGEARCCNAAIEFGWGMGPLFWVVCTSVCPCDEFWVTIVPCGVMMRVDCPGPGLDWFTRICWVWKNIRITFHANTRECRIQYTQSHTHTWFVVSLSWFNCCECTCCGWICWPMRCCASWCCWCCCCCRRGSISARKNGGYEIIINNIVDSATMTRNIHN